MVSEQTTYYKLDGNKKMFYFDNKLIGDFFNAKKYLINHLHMAPTKAEKKLDKIKKWEEMK